MENKKAQGMSVNTIILIVLGLIILVVLILGFSMGWANLKDLIAPSNNVDKIVQQCEIACNTDQKYAFCSEKRELKSTDEKLEDVTCYSLAEKKSVYGVAKCSIIDCGVYASLTLAKEACANDGDEIQYLEGLQTVVYPCAASDIVPEEPVE